jgi:hypothetical protein
MASHKKKKELKKKRRLQRLRQQRARSDSLPPDDVVIYDLPGAEKMSGLLLELVEPYMDVATTEEALRKLLTVGMIAWNAALLPPAEGDKLIRDTEKTLPREARADFRTIIEPLIQRKLNRFAGNQRAILSFDLSMRPSGPFVQVMSTLPAM